MLLKKKLMPFIVIMLKISEKSSSYLVPFKLFTLTFNNFADTFIQSDLQMRVIEAIKNDKRATVCVLWHVPFSLTQYT